MKTPVVIQAVRARAPMVDYITRHIPHAIVCWDDDADPMGNFLRSLVAADTGHIHLEDDVTLSTGFIDKALLAIGSGNGFVQFFSRVKDDLTEGTRIRPGSSFMGAVAFYVPPGAGKEIANYYPAWPGREHHRTGFDLLVASYLKDSRRRYLNVVPSLVQHSPLPSMLGRRSKARQSPTFHSPELSGHPYPDLFS
jgi:hypothetical protein